MTSRHPTGPRPMFENDDPAAEHAAFAESLQALLRKDEQQLDYVTASRLSAARARAVAAAGNGRLRWPWLTAVPTACALALAVWLALPGMTHRQPSTSAAAPVDVLEALGSEEAPVADEELDFAQWLDQQPAAAAGTADAAGKI